MRKFYDPWLNHCRKFGLDPSTGKEPVDEGKAAYRRSVKERRKQKRGKR
jgi:hypothetical protein